MIALSKDSKTKTPLAKLFCPPIITPYFFGFSTDSLIIKSSILPSSLNDFQFPASYIFSFLSDLSNKKFPLLWITYNFT